MKWNRNRQLGIYTSDNKRWSISLVDKKWVLKDTKNHKEYKGATLKSMQNKALDIEISEMNQKKKVNNSVDKSVNHEDIIINGAERFESFSKDELLNKSKTLNYGLGKFVPVQGKILK